MVDSVTSPKSRNSPAGTDGGVPNGKDGVSSSDRLSGMGWGFRHFPLAGVVFSMIAFIANGRFIAEMLFVFPLPFLWGWRLNGWRDKASRWWIWSGVDVLSASVPYLVWMALQGELPPNEKISMAMMMLLMFYGLATTLWTVGVIMVTWGIRFIRRRREA